METGMNITAITTAAVMGFALSGLWYGPLFGKQWVMEVGLKQEQMDAAPKMKMFGICFFGMLITAITLAFIFVQMSVTGFWGLIYGMLAGLGIAGVGLMINGMFEQKSWKLIRLNLCFWMTSLSVMGLILGYWK